MTAGTNAEYDGWQRLNAVKSMVGLEFTIHPHLSAVLSRDHFDGLGSVVALSDAAGDTVQTYEYSIYGQVAASDPDHPNPYLFTGRRFDTETGLYYYRARYYNPYIGRFMQTDPVGYSAGINLYTYCGNNPIGRIDPSGMYGYYIWEGGDPSYYERLVENMAKVGERCDELIRQLNELIANPSPPCTAHTYDECPVIPELKKVRSLLRRIRTSINSEREALEVRFYMFDDAACPSSCIDPLIGSDIIEFNTHLWKTGNYGPMMDSSIQTLLLHELAHLHGLPQESGDITDFWDDAHNFDDLIKLDIEDNRWYRLLRENCFITPRNVEE